MLVGSLGNTIFTVSGFFVRTLDDFTIEGSAKWNQLDIINGPPKLQFAGAELDTVKFKCSFSFAFNVNPLKEVKRLNSYMKEGMNLLFLLGGKKVGSGRYVITSISQAHKKFNARGQVISMDITVSLKEYIE